MGFAVDHFKIVDGCRQVVAMADSFREIAIDFHWRMKRKEKKG